MIAGINAGGLFIRARIAAEKSESLNRRNCMGHDLVTPQREMASVDFTTTREQTVPNFPQEVDQSGRWAPCGERGHKPRPRKRAKGLTWPVTGRQLQGKAIV